MLRVGSNFGDFTIYVECKTCGHQGKVLPRDLRERYGDEAPVEPLIRKLRCSQCGSRTIWHRVRRKLNLR